MKINVFNIRIVLLTILACTVIVVHSQQVPSLKSRHDSVYFGQNYPFNLPILGNKAHSAGIRLPLPMGIMFNTLTGRQDLTIDNMHLGFGNYTNPSPPEMIDLSDIVVFNDISAQTATFNLRFDAWILPFLNIYGIVGQTKKADINVSLIQPIPLSINTNVEGTYFGYGVMAAGAIGPLFLSVDLNRSHNYNPRLDEPAKIALASFRAGPVFRFKTKPQMNVSLWTGTMYSHFNGQTDGSIDALELTPNAPDKIDDMHDNLNNWYVGLSPADKIKYYLLYTKMSEGLTNLKDNIINGYIRYSFNKSISSPWNMLLGAQWQINYRWQIRTETQFLGDRIAGLFSINYRFGIKGKNWFSKED